MKIAVSAGLSAKGDMYVQTCHNDVKAQRSERSKRICPTESVISKLKCNLFLLQLRLLYRLVAVGLLCFGGSVCAQSVYTLRYRFSDSSVRVQTTGLQTRFSDRGKAQEYVFGIPAFLRQKGYLAASVDRVQSDSLTAVVDVYLGFQYKWVQLQTDSVPPELLTAIGFREKNFQNRIVDYGSIRQIQERCLQRLEHSGYPFAQIFLDQIRFVDGGLSAALIVRKGPLYKIDSLRVFGDAQISNRFLQRYLELPNGSVYDKQKLAKIQSRLLQLPYLIQEKTWDLSFLGTGSILNLYLKNKKVSQINGLVGFLPTTNTAGQNKLRVTGDFNLNLKNGFGMGESLLILFQQIQEQSPRLQLSYQQPYLFGSAFGADFSFEGFKKDSSFLNIQLQLGVQYAFGGNRNGKVFLQQFITNINSIDTLSIRSRKRLPEQVDQTTTNIGVDYEWFNTDYRLNPRKGYDVRLIGSAGLRTIRINNGITSIKDPTQPSFDFASLYDSVSRKSYTFRLKLNGARYFPLGKQTTFKTGLQLGWVQSPRLFRNELFQIGGFRLLRGFDEESIFASAYSVLTFELRLLIGTNSFFYVFTDGGAVRNQSQLANTARQFIGAGLGLALQTKAGIFNLAFAAGKRDDLPLNMRQSKIHFGYFNFF